MILGSGGREHALGWKLAQEGLQLFFAPGNGGTQELGTNLEIGAEEIDKIVSWARDNNIDLVVVGPEMPLAAGIADAGQEAKVAVFGPSQQAAQLEADKAWAVEFMVRHRIPHPRSQVFSDAQAALRFIQEPPWQELVIKANGLAAGKGVVLPESRAEAAAAIKQIMVERIFGQAGTKVVVQERLSGPEVSLLAFTDGKTVIPLPAIQDHKRVFAADQGPNTGGMGAYGPPPFISPDLLQTVQETILQPTIDGARQDGYPYRGVLYAGLMLTKEGPKVLEYNVRFGDPETQPLMLLFNSPLAPVFFSCLDGNLDPGQVVAREGAAVCVVLTSEGYPGRYPKGKQIIGLNRALPPEVVVFQAGTALVNGQLVTNGGRVLGITAYGKDVAEACQRAYSVIGTNEIHFAGMHYRTDIAYQAR